MSGCPIQSRIFNVGKRQWAKLLMSLLGRYYILGPLRSTMYYLIPSIPHAGLGERTVLVSLGTAVTADETNH